MIMEDFETCGELRIDFNQTTDTKSGKLSQRSQVGIPRMFF